MKKGDKVMWSHEGIIWDGTINSVSSCPEFPVWVVDNEGNLRIVGRDKLIVLPNEEV